MSKCDLKIQLETAMKDAMRAKEKEKLGTIRMMLSEIKRIEVDERIDVDNARVIATLDKMLKQRKDSISQFKDAGRNELAEQEEKEITIIQTFLPKPLTENEITNLIEQAVEQTGAETMQDMGKIMGILKPQMQGRADMAEVSKSIKAKLI